MRDQRPTIDGQPFGFAIPNEPPKRSRRDLRLRAEEIGISPEEARRNYETTKQICAIWKKYRKDQRRVRKAAR